MEPHSLSRTTDCGEPASSTSSPGSYLDPSASKHSATDRPKYIIRKITPLDPIKLQQSGLDRKIAEALSKQKSQNSKSLNRKSDVCASTSKASSTAAKNTTITKKVKLPKITITGPEVLTDEEKQSLANLNPLERLMHVKHLLNKKLLQKRTAEADDNADTSNDNQKSFDDDSNTSIDNADHSKHLKPPQSLSSDLTNCKLPTKQREKPQTKLYCVLKEPTEPLKPPLIVNQTKIKHPQKPQQNIGLKSDFHRETEIKATTTDLGLNKDTKEIPKASIKAGQGQQQNKHFPSNAAATQSYNKDGVEKVPIKRSYKIINNFIGTKNIPPENIQPQTTTYFNEIPKASIKPGQSHQLNQSAKNVDVPEISPSKKPFPMTTVSKETSLSTMDYFKKPYPMASSICYGLAHKSLGQQNEFVFKNSEIGLSDQQPSQSHASLSNLASTSCNSAPDSSIANCLIVLENKILSQDEMIDLTELRLSKSKLEAPPGFITPHKPIPEVVIKVENTDEYPVVDLSTPPVIMKKSPDAKVMTDMQTDRQNAEKSTDRVILPNTKTKILINAHKLKMPPEQLAVLAKKIKQASSLPAVNEASQDKAQQDIRILKTKAASKKHLIKPTPSSVVPHNIEIFTETHKDMPQKFIIQKKQAYTDVNKTERNYQPTQTKEVFKGVNDSNFVRSTSIENNNKVYALSQSQVKLQQIQQDNLMDYSKSAAVEIVDEPLETEDCFSAVDFIAALSNTNHSTVENSLELSTDEVNLNASCSTNVSPLRLQTYATPICEKTSTPKMKTNINQKLLNNPNMNTIVIESSKGPETVLMNEDANKSAKLQTLEVFHNSVLRGIDIKKSFPDTLMKHVEFKVTNKQPPSYVDMNSANVTPNKFDDPKLCNDEFVYDNNLSKRENEPSTIHLSTMPTNSMIKIELEKSYESADNSCHNISQQVLVSFREPTNTDFINVKAANDHLNQRTCAISNVSSNENGNKFLSLTSTTPNFKLGDIIEIAPSESSSGEISYSNTQSDKLTGNFTKIATTESQNLLGVTEKVEFDQQNILPAKIAESSNQRTDLNKFISDSIKVLDIEANPIKLSQNNTIPKAPQYRTEEVDQKLDSISNQLTSTENALPQQEIDVCKTNATSSNVTVTKRISRFKKGKINLVQRNKPGQVPNAIKKTVDPNCTAKLSIDSEKQVAGTADEVNTVVAAENELNKNANKSSNENEKQLLNATMITNKTSQQMEVSTSIWNANETQNSQRANNTLITDKVIEHSAVGEGNVVHNISENIHKSIQHVIPIKNDVFSIANSQIVIPKSSIKTGSSSQQPSNSPRKSFTKCLSNKIEASTIVDISSQQQEKRIDTKDSTNTGDSLEQHLNSQGESYAKSKIAYNIDIPKASIKIGNSPDKSRQVFKLDKMIKTDSKLTPNQTTIEQQENEKNISEIRSNDDAHTVSNQLQDNIDIGESSYENITATFQHPKIQTSGAQESNTENSIECPKIDISNKTKNLNPESDAALNSTKSAKISLIDIVKHSPTKVPASCPVLPFQKVCNVTSEKPSETKGIETLLKQIKDSNKSKSPVENAISIEASATNANKDEQPFLSTKRSSRSDSKNSESQAEIRPPAITPRKIYSTRPLISDDDLEFLPENAEVEFKLSKSKHNEKNKESDINTPPLIGTAHKRQQRLYSKPLDSELNSSSKLANRTRYYSQTLEANVTITFDNLKSKTIPSDNINSLETEDSCHDSTQDFNIAPPIKQRKKLRKTMEDIKKSQKSHHDTDSDDDNHDFECSMKDREESNEFLGFEEISNSSNFQQSNFQQDFKENEPDGKTKHSTLKNWLTTGKAISPTFDKMETTKQLRNDDELCASSSFAVHEKTKELKCLKKSYHLSSNHYEETDITDDTSPADDEEEISEQIATVKKIKHKVKNATSIKEDLTKNKKIKLDDSNEHNFIKPRNLRGNLKKSDTDFGDHEEKSKKPQSKAFKDVCADSPSNKKEEIKSIKKATKSAEIVENVSRESDYHEEISSKVPKLQINAESLGTANSTKEPNERSGLEAKSKISDKGCRKRKKSKRKEKGNDDNIENLDIPPQKKAAKKAKNSKTKSGKSVEKVKNTNFQADQTDANLSTQTNSPNKIESITSVDKDKLEVSCATPQHLTKERKNRRSKLNTKQIQTTSSDSTAEVKAATPIKAISSDKETSFSQTSSKKSIISDSSEDECNIPSTKKRNLKRKLKIYDSDSDCISTQLTNSQENESVVNIATQKAKKKSKIATPTQELIKNESPAPANSRKRRSNTESNFNPRLLLITKREQLDTDEPITPNSPGSGSIQCGLCLARTQPAKWRLHLAEHYGIGWQVGEEKLRIENRTVVFNNITNYLKDRSSKELACRMCKKIYRSALGLLTHIEACGMQAVRVICEFCEKDYSKSSLPIHIRTCSARIALENRSANENLHENDEKKEEIFGNTGRIKRNSTIKAENKLKALGAELENVVIEKKPVIDPKSNIRYVPPIQGNFNTKWSRDIKKLGHASCPKSRCKFKSNDIKELSEHLKNCNHIKSGYFCNYCRQVYFNSEQEAIEHVMKNHQDGRSRKKSDDLDCNLKTDDEQSSEDDMSEGVDEAESDDNVVDESDDLDDTYHSQKGRKVQKIKTPYNRNANQSTNQLARKEVFDGRYTDLNKEVLKKWKSFLSLNYSSEPLYVEFAPQYSVLKNSDFKIYLPTQTVSMKFNFKTKKSLNTTVGVPEKNIEWSELRRYESISNNMNTYFFLGAPVKLCVWLPLPDHVKEQYMAVVYRQEMLKYIKFSQPKQHHNIVLIFKVVQKNNVPELNVHYGFMVCDGPVHHLSFLPSGGYDESSNRLGLVAVATINSTIKIYALPINVELSSTLKECTSNDNIVLIDVKPSFLLNLDILQKKDVQHILLNTQCLQICWSEYSGHQHVFASFSNGFLGIWDVTNALQENLNRFVIDDVINYAALNYIYVGEKGVKCFAIHYDTEGPRWLAASGAYRKFVIYDIRNFMQPVIMKDEVNKNILLSMDWCPLWETVLYSYCDAIPNNGRCVVAVNPTNIMFQQNKLDIMTGSVTQVHYTPVTNMCVTALNNGDIVFLDTKELHYECVLSRKSCDRRLLYTMDVKKLNGEPLVRLAKGTNTNDISKVPSDWLMYDDNYKEKYGLIFAPLIRIKETDRKIYSSETRCPPVNMIPLMRINTLRCNVNFNGKHLIALGYENGFIRLVYFNKQTVSCK